MSLTLLSESLGNNAVYQRLNNQSMDPFIGAGVALGSGIYNAISQSRANKRAYENQLSFWRMNNEYNHPTAQMARLREAGLNPNLVYGQGAKGATGGSTQASAPPVNAPEFQANPIAQYQNMEGQKLQFDNLRAQNTLLKQKEYMNVLEMQQKSLSNRKQKEFLNYYSDILQTQLSAQQSDASMKNIDSTLKSWEYQFIDRNQALFTKYLNSKYLQGWENLNNSQKLGKLRDLEIHIKNDLKDFTQANQFTSILTKLLMLLK